MSIKEMIKIKFKTGDRVYYKHVGSAKIYKGMITHINEEKKEYEVIIGLDKVDSSFNFPISVRAKENNLEGREGSFNNLKE